MVFDPAKPYSVRNRILEAMAERLKCVVSGSSIRFDTTSVALSLFQYEVTGTYGFDVPRSFDVEFLSSSEVRLKEYKDDGETLDSSIDLPFTSGVPFAILDTGCSVSVDTSSGTITPGLKFEVRFNSCNSTIRDVVRWEKIGSNISYPCAIIYPHREWKDPRVSDRYQNTLKVYITLWYDQEPDDVIWFEEFLADVQNELLRDVHFGQCCSYDFSIDEVTVVDGENSTERVGALLECSILYRHSDTNTRTPRN